jgi:serine/threonine protein kinase/tetratricopeptide (TPR) repeat protein
MKVIDPQDWPRVKDILQGALEREAAERDGFVWSACAGDERLLHEVQSLLAWQTSAAHVMEEPAAEALQLTESDADTMTGRRIGPYRLLREIGRGGMGAVYLATRDDQQYQQEVAIKLVKRGMDSDLVIRRFRHERQILANLTHANIARLFDGGTTEDGLPYFVMEHVAGVPIDQYCQARQLTLVERLRLFRTVCSAVQYAHSNLVVHRDLKPTNILVTADGVAKLLDFGIAKVIDVQGDSAAANLTVVARPMTPEYASPEQARGEPISVATDVYSLGVLLYELLTGLRPYVFASRGSDEITRVICEEQPVKPSTAVMRPPAGRSSDGHAPASPETRDVTPRRLRRQLQGDLDNLVLMALRKEPARRYASVERLSDDIRRYLERRPLQARPDTVPYRTARFVQRNKVAVVAAALIVLTLAGGVVTTTRAAQRAERRFNDVRALANAFVFDIHDAIKDLPGATPARELLVRKALQYLDVLAAEASGDVALQRELATAYQKIGDVQGNHNYSNLGDTPGALASYRKAVDIHEALVTSVPGQAQAHFDLSVSYIKIGDMQLQVGDNRNARSSYERALDVAEAARRVDPSNLLPQRNLAFSHHKVGNVLLASNDLDGALRHHEEALKLREMIAAAMPADTRAVREVGTSHDRLARVLRRRGDLSRALDHAQRALAGSESLAAREPSNAEARRDVGVGLQAVGLIQLELGDLAGALDHFRKGLVMDEAMAAADPLNAGAQRDLASSLEMVGDVLDRMGDTAGALASYERTTTVVQQLGASDPSNADPPAALAILWAKRGALHSQFGGDLALPRLERVQHWRTARAAYEHSLRAMEDLKKRGITLPADARSPEAIIDEIRKCDAALGALAES